MIHSFYFSFEQEILISSRSAEEEEEDGEEEEEEEESKEEKKSEPQKVSSPVKTAESEAVRKQRELIEKQK